MSPNVSELDRHGGKHCIPLLLFSSSKSNLAAWANGRERQISELILTARHNGVYNIVIVLLNLQLLSVLQENWCRFDGLNIAHFFFVKISHKISKIVVNSFS